MPKYRLEHVQEINLHTFLWAQKWPVMICPLKGIHKWYFNLGIDIFQVQIDIFPGFPPSPQEEKQSEANNEQFQMK